MGKMQAMKKHFWKIVLVLVIVVAAIVVGGYYWLNHTTYERIEIVDVYENESTMDGKYIQFIDGVLEYSRDGIAMLTKEGEELWNQPSQMGNPIVEVCKDMAVVADKNGTAMYVFQKSGLKGEIQTTTPIEKVTVSAQGIVAAILKDEETPKVMCYDADGNVLIEHRASMGNTGYPVDIALSQDGQVLCVSYLGVKGSDVFTKVAYYHFGKAGEDKKDYQVASFDYVDAVIPTVTFLDRDTSLLIGDNGLVLVEGLEEPRENLTISLEKEIKSVAFNEKYVALVLKNAGQSDYELCLFNVSGELEMSVPFEGEYSNMKICGDEIVFCDGSQCCIYNSAGICKFKGNLEMNIMDIVPNSGINKYIVISTKGFQGIRLVK